MYMHAYICAYVHCYDSYHYTSVQVTYTLVMECCVVWTLTGMVFLMFSLTVLTNTVKRYTYTYTRTYVHRYTYGAYVCIMAVEYNIELVIICIL